MSITRQIVLPLILVSNVTNIKENRREGGGIHHLMADIALGFPRLVDDYLCAHAPISYIKVS